MKFSLGNTSGKRSNAIQWEQAHTKEIDNWTRNNLRLT